MVKPHHAQRVPITPSLTMETAPVFCQVTLGKVLKVIVVMRSLFIDRTIVKGYNENVYTEDGKVSMLASFVFSVIFCIPEQMYSSTR